MVDEKQRASRICLLTGAPGCGKTTLIRRLVAALAKRNLAGFLTEEILDSGRRQGFLARDLAGRTCVLAHREIQSHRRVGAYGVDLEAFERLIVTNLAADVRAEAFIIDEIGKMELKSEFFARVLQRLVDSDRPLLATIPVSPLPLVQSLRRRGDAMVVEMVKSRRAAAAVQLASWCLCWELGAAEDLKWAATY